MALNPISAALRNPTKQNVKVTLTVPAGAPLDAVADQLIAAGLREQEEPPAFLAQASADEEPAEEPAPTRRRRAKAPNDLPEADAP